MRNYIHITEKNVRGSGLYVVKEVSGGNYLLVDSFHAFFEIMKNTHRGDSLIFHGRACSLSSLPFLLCNRIFRRNKVGYQPHTRLRPILRNRLLLNFFFDKVFCLTDHNRRELEAFGVKNTMAVPNPIPIGRIAPFALPHAKKSCGIAWASRDVPCKRLPMFIRAVEKEGRVRALILAPELEESNRQLAGKVRNIKTVEGLEGREFFAMLQTANAFAFTSDENEGFPISILEAAYLKMPIIASDYPKYREMLGGYAKYWKSETDLIKLIRASGSMKMDNGERQKIMRRYDPARIRKLYQSW